MVREILFRGKRLDTGEWIEGYYAKQSNHACFAHELKHQHFIFEDVFLDFNLGGLQEFEVVPETVGQYTGLTDKNGKKIFEGDIAKFRRFENNYIGKIIFNYKTAGFEFRWDVLVVAFGEKATYTANLSVCDEIEVIGNIYDNPELLKRSKDNE